MTTQALETREVSVDDDGAESVRAGKAITIRIPSIRLTKRGTTGGRKLTFAVALILCILLGANAWLWRSGSSKDSIEQSRTAAVAAAEVAVPKMLTYSYKTLDSDLATARAQTTGAFQSDYSKLIESVVAPAAKAKQVTTKAVLRGSAVVEASRNHVVVLVFITQTTSSGSNGTPLVTGSRADVTMTRVSGHWLISSLNPV